MRLRRKTDADGARVRQTRRTARLVLGAAAAGGAYVSWGSIYAAVSTADIGRHSPVLLLGSVSVNVAAAVVAALLDLTILGSSLMYVDGVLASRPAGAWRGMAHVGIAATLAANLGSAQSAADVGWHLIAPAVWAGIVEFTARDILGDMRAVAARRAEAIPLRLWLTAPVESARTSFRMLRTGQTEAARVRLDADRRRAAADALRLELEAVEPSRARRRRVRRLAGRRLWAGTISSDDVFRAIGWDAEDGEREARGTDAILRSLLSAVRGVESIPVPIHSIEPTGSAIGSSIGSIGSIESGRVGAEGDREPGTAGGRIGSVVPLALAGSGAAAPPDRGRVLADREGAGDRTVEVVAREDDVARIRSGVLSGNLTWPLVVEQVRGTLRIAPKYARAAVRHVAAEGDPRAQAQAQEQAHAPVGPVERAGEPQVQQVTGRAQEHEHDIEETQGESQQETTKDSDLEQQPA